MANKTIYSKDSRKLGKWLREKRDDLGYSLSEFEEVSGWDRSIIGKIETGHRRLDVIEFVEICRFLACDPHEAIDFLVK